MDQQEFIADALENGGMTPAKAAQLIAMIEAEGETEGSENSEIVAPDNELKSEEKTAEPVDHKHEKPTPPDDQLTAENAVVMAKDGKHTINFEVLASERVARAQERDGRLAAEAKAEAQAARAMEAEAKLAQLQAQAQARADAGQAPTQADTNAAAAQAAIDAGIDPALFGDFSPEAMAKGVAQLVQAQVAAQMAAIDAKLQPLQQQTAKSAAEAHLSAIYTAHPDADSVVESREFAAWKAGQPSIVQQALDRALTEGSTGQVIEVFDAFKKAGAAVSQPPAQPKADPAAAAKAAIDALKPTPPASLSDIPGGRPAAVSLFERLSGMPAYAQVDAMDGMTDEQINSYLNSRI